MNLLNDMLEQENGFRVVAKADNGEDAYEMIMKTNPDLVPVSYTHLKRKEESSIYMRT